MMAKKKQAAPKAAKVSAKPTPAAQPVIVEHNGKSGAQAGKDRGGK